MNEYIVIDDRHHEVLQSGDVEALDEVVHPDFVGHDLTWPGSEIIGVEGYKDYVRRLCEAFPDLRVETVQRVAGDDVLVCHAKFSGRHEGAFMGMAPTGREMAVDVVTFLTFRDGKIAGMTLVYDAMGVAMQLGMLPEPTATA